MLNPDIWITGGTAMAVGMGVVFIFLIIMVFAIMIMTKCVNIIDKIWPLPVEEPKVKKTKSSNDESEIALAIACAHLSGNGLR